MRVFRSGTMALAHMNRPAFLYTSVEDIKKIDDLGNSKDWAVAGGDGSVIIKHDVRTRVALRLADIEVCDIGVSCKDHVTSSEEDAVVGVSGNVIQDLE